MFKLEPNTEEERLRQENEELKRQLTALKTHAAGMPGRIWQPSRTTLWSLLLGVALLLTIAFLAGYIPLSKRETVIAGEVKERDTAIPRVAVVRVESTAGQNALDLSGSIEAVTEAPILARSDGYIKRRLVDIGDRVKAGQPLAEIEAPEMDDQVRQAQASLGQARAAFDQAKANLQQGKSDLELSRVTAERWNKLVAKGGVSKQENDQYQAQYQSRQSNVHSLEEAINVQRSNVAAAEANLARLGNVQSYRIVRAPFDGVVTQRNVDSGALATAGSTLLFRIAQAGTLRTYINVPQSYANDVKAGQPAQVSVANLPGRLFTGTVARSAHALDPASRTLLVEVRVDNRDGLLMPGMYAQVSLQSVRSSAPLLIPSDALIVGSAGTNVALVRPEDHTIHVQPIVVGRDYGDRLEVVSGLQPGDMLIPNAGDMAHEGSKIEPLVQTQ